MNSFKFNISNSASSNQIAHTLQTESDEPQTSGSPFKFGVRRPYRHSVMLPGQHSAVQQSQANGLGSFDPGKSNSIAFIGSVKSTPAHQVGKASSASTLSIDQTDNRTIELKYFDDLQKGGKYGVRDGLLHRWNGSHWEAQDGDQGHAKAMGWLKSHHPERVTSSTAKSCFQTATLLAPKLQEQNDKRCIIPLLDVYLEVTDTGIISVHKPDPSFGLTYALNLSLKVNGNTYTPGAVPAQSFFGKFLDTSVPDKSLQDYLQEGMGYTLTPYTIHQVALMLKGSGRNGKSVMVRILQALHARTAAMDLRNLKGFGLSQLVGASLAIAEEVPERGLNTQTLKALISGEATPINRKYLSEVSYRSKAKWIICTNLDQRSDDNSDGFWRRLVVIPFSEQIATKDVVAGLDQKIIDNELKLVLDWCLTGLQRLIVRGSLPPEPQSVIAAKNLAITASDPVASWVQEEGVQASTNPTDMKSKDYIFSRYCAWCAKNKVRTMESAAFWARLRKLVQLEPDSQLRVNGGRQRFVQLKFISDYADEIGGHPFTD